MVVDNHPAVHVGGRELIADQADIAVAAEAATAEEALVKLDTRIEVVIIGYRVGSGCDGVCLTVRLKQLDRPAASSRTTLATRTSDQNHVRGVVHGARAGRPRG